MTVEEQVLNKYPRSDKERRCRPHFERMQALREIFRKRLNENNMEKTIGESRVRTEFNPANSSLVDQIKQKSAELINVVDQQVNAKEGLEGKDLGEFIRLKSLSMTAYEEAAMWAVKAATF